MHIMRAKTPKGSALVFKRLLVGSADRMNDTLHVGYIERESEPQEPAMMMFDTADLLAILAEIVPETKPQWVRLAEKMPPVDVHVLVGNEKGEAIACWLNHDNVFRTAQGLPVRLDFMTHWCLHTPIPKG